MDTPDYGTFEQALNDHNWPLFAACVILLLVRVAKLPFLGNQWDKIPKEYRPAIPVLLGLLSGIGDSLVAGRAWLPAILYGLMSGLLAMGADQAAKPVKETWKKLPKADPK
jgi:hypothetical protein